MVTTTMTPEYQRSALVSKIRAVTAVDSRQWHNYIKSACMGLAQLDAPVHDMRAELLLESIFSDDTAASMLAAYRHNRSVGKSVMVSYEDAMVSVIMRRLEAHR